ncbi:MAG: regulatory iron-sulfur-containing complex subunit RicT [Candidatus Moranbacteria bacterium]|nr:regulatory iron-sulfur-containing complex subunit RicT [Candidatus Moranbacteria bacterium]
MSKYLVNVYKWDDPSVYEGQGDFSDGDTVVVECEIGKDIGTVISVADDGKESQYRVLRKATKRDVETFNDNNEKKSDIFDIAHKEVKRMGIEMKLVDAHVSLEKNIIIAFTADGRVDFRQLVKNLSKIFQCLVRMRQIGSRDEARKLGGCGICGRELCCAKFPGSIPSISTEMAKIQQVSHRGSERISGLCGRLMCCLSYESEQYRELLKGMPELYSRIRTRNIEGDVIEINAIKQEVKVRTKDKQIVTIKKEDLK